jgi:hypothetical protein
MVGLKILILDRFLMLVIIFVVLFYVKNFLMMKYIDKIKFNKCPLFTIK